MKFYLLAVAMFSGLLTLSSGVQARDFVVQDTVSGFSSRNYGVGAALVKRYVGRYKAGVAVSLSGFRTDIIHPNSVGKDPDDFNFRMIEVASSGAQVKYVDYDPNTGWLTFRLVTRLNDYYTNPLYNNYMYWEAGYTIIALDQ